MVHLIFVCKYRKKLLVVFGSQVQQILYDIAQENHFEIVEMEGDKDHIHLLISYNPIQSVLEIVRMLKQVSTYRIWRMNYNFILLQKYFWKEQIFWSDGYFACSIGNVSKEII
jgi:putative transposase